MQSMYQALEGSFTSERLIYKILDNDNTQHNEFMYRTCWAEPLTTGLSNLGLLRPLNRQQAQERVSGIVRSSIVAVVMVLRRELASPVTTGSTLLDQRMEQEDILVGHVHVAKPYPDEVFTCRSASIGISVDVKYQGQGFGREAINWALDYCFRYAGLHRVEIGTVSFNQRALDLYTSIGFVQESCRRKVAFFDMKWHNEIQLAMLDEEYIVIRERQTRERMARERQAF